MYFLKVRFHVSRHHAERLALRGISQEDAKGVVLYGQSVPAPAPVRHGGKLKKFSKTIGLKTLIVIAEIKRDECWLVTAYEI